MSTTAIKIAAAGATTAAFLLLPLACSRAPRTATTPAPAPVAASAAQPEGPEIVRIVGRHPTIIVTAGPDGPRYSAQADDATMIVSNVTLDELRAGHPEIARFVEPAMALGEDSEIHAGLDRSRVPEERGMRLLRRNAFSPSSGTVEARR
jgi:hypothetical protein